MIWLAISAYRQAHGRIEAEFTDLGEQELKNIAKPVRVYAVTASPRELPRPAAQRELLEPPLWPPRSPRAKARPLQRWPPLAAALAALFIVIAGGAWWFLNAKPPTPARHSIVVLFFNPIRRNRPAASRNSGHSPLER
jgi:hypothetical protein